MTTLQSIDQTFLINGIESKVLLAIKRGDLKGGFFTAPISDWYLTAKISFIGSSISVDTIDITHETKGECLSEDVIIETMKLLVQKLKGLATTKLQRKIAESTIVRPTVPSSTKITIDAYLDASILTKAVSEIMTLHLLGLIDKNEPIEISGVSIYVDIATNNIGLEYVRDITLFDGCSNERAGMILKLLLEDELIQIYKEKQIPA